MKMFRWFLCHLLSITLLVSCIVLFVSRDALKGDFNRLTGKVLQPITNVTASASKSKNNINNSQQIDTNLAKGKEIIPNQTGNSAETVKVIVEPEITEPAISKPVFSAPAISETPVAEPAIPEPAITQTENKAGNSETLQRDNIQQAPGPESISKSNDPWATVLEGVGDRDMRVSEFGSDVQAMPLVEHPADSSFPPENYDPEESSTGFTEEIEAAEPGTAFSPFVDRKLPDQPISVKAQTVEGKSLAQQFESSDGMLTSDPLPDQAEYFTALEKARRLNWDGNAGMAQAAFEKLMFDYPEMPEAAADLGNLLLQQGNREGAIWAYQNAIPRYLNLHREQEAINLTRFVSQYDPALAESLQQKYW